MRRPLCFGRSNYVISYDYDYEEQIERNMVLNRPVSNDTVQRDFDS